MKILLDDQPFNSALFPFAQVRSLAHIRVGILTIYEKWKFYFPGKVFISSEISDEVLQNTRFESYPANVIPSNNFLKTLSEKDHRIEFPEDSKILTRPWQIFQYNDWAIRQDFEIITAGRISEKLPEGTRAMGLENIFIEEGAKINFSIINAESGPVYIGKNAEIMEGCLLRGPVSIGDHSILKMGTKIYGATTIGPNCVAGGEIKNSIMMEWSNKGHDGYLGDSVLGEWCNLGAGTSNSNLKNNASGVKVWVKDENTFEDAGLKCGLLMGSYSRSAINTSFNTGTVVGISCNVFGTSFPSKFIDNFTWGEEEYDFEKALVDIVSWKKLKGVEATLDEKESLKTIYKKNKHEKTDCSSQLENEFNPGTSR
ncbi:MAG: putative sugar nucleotidyl transferase [Ginsengibacter sp.]